MKRGFLFSAALAAAFAFAIPALAGVQVTTCQDLGGGVWRYTFFACAPNVDANDLHINLLGSEITSGEAVVGCAVPAIAGFSCSSTATGASYFFPQIGPFQCVPALPGDANKFVIDVQTADGVSGSPTTQPKRRGGSRATIWERLVHSPTAGCLLTPRNCAPMTGRSKPSAHSTLCSSMLNRGITVMSLMSSQTRVGGAAMALRTQTSRSLMNYSAHR